MNYARQSLRNLTRNYRRTIITTIGIAVAGFLMIMWGFFSNGFADTMKRNAIAMSVGDLQIHHPKYRDDPNLFFSMAIAPSYFDKLTQKGFAAAPRRYAFAFAAVADKSAGIELRGIDPEREAQVTIIHNHIHEGQWLQNNNPKGVVIGRGLAKSLGAKIGGELILMTQAADGSLTSDLYTVIGITRAVSSKIDNRSVFLTNDAFAQLMSFPSNAYHEIAIHVLDPNLKTSDARLTVANMEPPGEVSTWEELQPILVRIFAYMRYSFSFSFTLTYLALAGLVINTMFMGVLERTREFGVLLALGTLPRQIILLVICEALWLALVGAIVAVAFALPFGYYIQLNGLDFRAITPQIAVGGLLIESVWYGKISFAQVTTPLVFLFLTLPIASLIPALKASRLNPITALTGR